MLGFVSPEGKFYECKYFGHIQLADELLEKIYKIKSNNPIYKLCELGWAVIQSSFMGFAGDDFLSHPSSYKQTNKLIGRK